MNQRADLTAFYMSKMQEPLGFIRAMESEAVALGKEDPSLALALAHYHAVKDSLTRFYANGNGSPAAMAAQANALNQLSSALAQVDSLRNNQQGATTTQVLAMLDQLSTRTDGNLYEQNYYLALKGLYYVIQDPTDSTVAGSLAELESLAAECPLVSGPAVYVARSIVARYENTYYDDASSCYDAGYLWRVAGHDAPVASWTLQPNPALDLTRILFSKAKHPSGVFKVLDIMGKILLEGSIDENMTEVPVETPFPSGVYTMQVRMAGESSYTTQKLVIIN
jgi:hypothetical protein